MEAGGGAPLRVSEEAGYNLQVSPNGDALYFARIRDGEVWIWKMLLDAPSLAERVAKPIIRMSDSFSVGKRGVYFVPVRLPLLEQENSISFFDFMTESIHPVARIQSGVQYQISVSRDEQRLLYAWKEFEVANVMIVQEFR